MGDRLDEYRDKRQAGLTPEPFGSSGGSRPRLFVVQKHAASSLHYDFRLEWQGVLLSWAVPRGPSRDPGIKRLAVQTEDHPVDYADFEGVIPEGNYGAGQVIVWDQGTWIPKEPMEEGLKKGKLLFELRGHKLRGVWTIFRTKKDGEFTKEWLLVKKPDGWAGEDDWPEESVFSGRLVEELKEGSSRAADVDAALADAGAEKSPLAIEDAKVMLAQTELTPFSSPDWVYELKYDGFRLLCGKEKLLYRSGRAATGLFPEVMRSMRSLPFSNVVLDTEVVVLDEEAKPDFQRLQRRAQMRRASEIARATVELPVVCYVFDLLALGDYDLRALPLTERKHLLRMVLPPAGVLRYADHIEEQGKAFHEQAALLGLEGIMAKRADSAYRGGRSDAWLKVPVERRDEFAIVGWTAPKGSREGLGALHLAAYEGGELVYLGRVGTGFSDRLLKELHERLRPLQVDEPPCIGPVPRTEGHFWTQPLLVADVRYKERTADGLLRQPAFMALREDKKPEECFAPEARAPLDAEEPVAVDVTEDRTFTETNLHKVFWPEQGYTKGDLIAYYRTIAPLMLPYLEDRPVVMTRYPDGIDGKSFYQKDAPEWVPGWLRTERVWSEQTQREIDYFVCDDAESLAFLANLGTIPLHVWSSSATDLAKPDWCILDLDPKGAPFQDVVAIAKAIKRLCDKVEFPAFVKTSGSTGLHILLPLHRMCTYDQSRSLGELIARIIEAELSDIATTARALSKREGKVYIDFGQNAHGQLLVAPYSVRPLPGAPVSAPLRWSEVNDKLTLDKFTIRTMPGRVKRMKDDPLRPVLDLQPDLVEILGRLAELVRK
jgi:bifunctional non-homologous end joining protein LigD